MTDTLKEIVGDVSVGKSSEITSEAVSFKPIPTKDCIPTPSTLLNVALSNNIHGGFKKGSILLLLAESSTGKTAFSLSVAASCIKKKSEYGEITPIYFDKEESCNFNMESIFGIPEDSFEIVSVSNDSGRMTTLERTFLYILKKLEEGKPYLFVIDSMSAYITESMLEVTESNIKNADKDLGSNKQSSLDIDKMCSIASVTSRYLGLLKERLASTGSFLILIQQYRENVGRTMPAESKVKISGGKVIKYTADYIITLRKGKSIIKKAASGRDIEQGSEIILSIDKNRSTGISDKIILPYLKQTGFRDSRSMFEYLVTTKAIKQVGARYTAEWLTGSDKSFYEKDIRIMIKDNPELLDKMRDKVYEIWMEDLKSVYEDY